MFLRRTIPAITRTAFFGLLLIAWTSALSAQLSEQDRIVALENAWNQALVLKDARAIESLLAPELIFIASDGKVTNRASYLEDLQSPQVHLDHASSDSMRVQLYSRSAIVTGIYRASGTKSGKPFKHSERFVDIWINRDGAWVCVASQSTLIKH